MFNTICMNMLSNEIDFRLASGKYEGAIDNCPFYRITPFLRMMFAYRRRSPVMRRAYALWERA